MSETIERADWIRSVLGMPIPLDSLGGGRAGPPPPDVKPPAKTDKLGVKPKAKGDGSLAGKPVAVNGPRFTYGDESRPVAVQNKGGAVVFTAPNPPVRGIVISGGGGKGVALVGMLRALEDAEITQGLKKVSGSSVGAMTAAMIAAGMTADELQAAADSPETVDTLTDGTGGGPLALLGRAIWNRGPPLTGEGLKKVVGDSLGGSLGKRVEEFLAQKGPNPAVSKLIEDIAKSPEGPTFRQLRELSAAVPSIKELSVTGTYTEELELGGTTERNTQGKLMVFDADNTPDMPVALAVQASAAFPKAFKPVDIDLLEYEDQRAKDLQAADDVQGVKPAYKVRFIDGGVMNNTPTASSIANEMPLDRVPDERAMTFVFQGSDSAKVAKDAESGQGPAYKAKPSGKLGRWVDDSVLKSNNAAAEYASARDAQAHAADFIVVPLKFDFKPPGSKLNPANWFNTDMSGTLGGTLNFSPNKARVAEIRSRTQAATAEQIKKTEDKAQSYAFGSEKQMLMGVPLGDLKTLAEGGCEGADDAYAFRVAADDAIGRVGASGAGLYGRAADVLAELEKLAGGDDDEAAYLARAIHKAGLEGLVNKVDGSKGQLPGKVAKAVSAVSEAKKAFAIANRLLRDRIDPKMQTEEKNGRSWALLRQVEGLLLGAVSLGEIAGALQMLVDHYRGKSDVMGSLLVKGAKKVAEVVAPVAGSIATAMLPYGHGHKEFFEAMTKELNAVQQSMSRE